MTTQTRVFEPVENPTPGAPRYGLVRSANVITEGTEHWGQGITWPTDPNNGDGAAVDPFEINTATLTIPADDDGPLKAVPFLCWEADRVSTIDQVTDLKAKAARRLLRSTTKQVEAEFWKGTRTQALTWGNLYLAHTGSVTEPNGTTGTPFVKGLSLLEQGLADNYDGSPGMIHCTIATMQQWAAEHLLYTEPNGGLIYTSLGNIVVPGVGYDGTAPGGGAAAADHAWAYATPLVTLRLSPVDTETPGGFIDKTNNTRQHWAVRLAAISVDPVVIGVNVDLTAIR